MQSLIILLYIAIVYTQSCAKDETLFYTECIKNSCFDTYLKRLKTVTDIDGIEIIPIIFLLDLGYEPQQIEVTLAFSDEAFDGIMKRDNTNSCITDKLYYYQAGWTNETQAIFPITSSYDSSTQFRVWKFTIPLTEEKSILKVSRSSIETISFTGYFGFKFFLDDALRVIYRFSFTVNEDVQEVYSSSFLQNANPTCTAPGICISQASSSLQFCDEPTCANPTISAPKLYLDHKFWILQKITTPGFTDFPLELLHLTFLGPRLSHRIYHPVSASSSGKLIIEIDVGFAYDANVEILIESNLGQSRKRVLQRNLQDTIMGTIAFPALAIQSTGDLGCIRLKKSDTDCPTCEQLKSIGMTCSTYVDSIGCGYFPEKNYQLECLYLLFALPVICVIVGIVYNLCRKKGNTKLNQIQSCQKETVQQ